MAKKKLDVEEAIVIHSQGVELGIEIAENKSEKELLIEVYEFMKSRGINSISDVENKIARA